MVDSLLEEKRWFGSVSIPRAYLLPPRERCCKIILSSKLRRHRQTPTHASRIRRGSGLDGRGRQTTGLISFVVPTVAQLAPTSQALWRMRGRQGQPITACFIDPDQVQHVPLLLESGAQIIVSQLDV